MKKKKKKKKKVIFALCKHLSTEVIKNFRALSSNLRL